jgi:hypothetical protein
LKGHGFSRADKANKMNRALQAAKSSIQNGFVTGHGFSRADKANQMSWALAPAKVRSSSSLAFGPFSAASSTVPFQILLFPCSKRSWDCPRWELAVEQPPSEY